MGAMSHISSVVSFPNTKRGISSLPACTHECCLGVSGSQEFMEHLWKEQGGKQMWEKSNFQWVWEGWVCALAGKSCEDLHSLTCSRGTSAYTDPVSILPCDGVKLPLLLHWRHHLSYFVLFPRKQIWLCLHSKEALSQGQPLCCNYRKAIESPVADLLQGCLPDPLDLMDTLRPLG